MNKSTHETGVRLDIQALRAIAIGTVVVFHIWAKALPGGFVGVDIFFVISGYLITGQLWREVAKTGKIRFGLFWARRARRLLPASLLVIAATLLLSLIFIPASLFLKFVNDATSSAFYVQNWVLAGRLTDYLQNDGTVSVFQHFWSLSVEEQYYVFWPIIMALAILLGRTVFKRVRRHRQLTVLGVLCFITLASFLFSVVLTPAQPEIAYFSTFTRAWEFAAGALLAVGHRVNREPAKARNPLWYWAGLGLVAVAVWQFDAHTEFPGWRATLPVVGTVLMLYAGESAKRFMPQWFFRFAPIKFLGDVSYSLYLWHWPLILLAPWVLRRDVTDVDGYFILALSILLAWLSKRFVEDPVRFGYLSRIRVAGQLTLSAFGMVLILALTSGVNMAAAANLDRNWGNTNLTPSLKFVADDLPALEKSECRTATGSTAFITCEKGNPRGKIRVGLIGDSHTRQYFSPIQALADQYGWSLTVISKSACPIMDNKLFPKEMSYPSCPTWNDKLKTYLADSKPFDLVITSASSLVTGAYPKAGLAFKSAIQSQILNRGTKLMAILDNPKPLENYVPCIEAYGPDAAKLCAYPRAKALTPIDRLAPAVKGLPGVIYVDFTDTYCSETCPPVIDGMIVYRDHSHLTDTFARTLRPAIDSYVPEEYKK